MIMSEKKPLRVRVREAGGLYAWFNTNLIRFAGPPTVGPYETEPPAAPAAKACPLCGVPMQEHTFDRSGPKTLMHCPV